MPRDGPLRGAPMTRRRAIEVGAVVWAVVGLVVGLRVLQSVNADAQLLVLLACVVGSGAALLASACLSAHRDRLAGALLAASAVSPDGVRLGVERPRGARRRGARDRADLGALGAARPADLAVELPRRSRHHDGDVLDASGGLGKGEDPRPSCRDGRLATVHPRRAPTSASASLMVGRTGRRRSIARRPGPGPPTRRRGHPG